MRFSGLLRVVGGRFLLFKKCSRLLIQQLSTAKTMLSEIESPCASNWTNVWSPNSTRPHTQLGIGISSFREQWRVSTIQSDATSWWRLLHIMVNIILCYWFTCIGRQVEVEDGDDGDEDAGEDDVQHVVQGLPLDDQVEGHVLVIIIVHVLPARLVSDVPLAALWRKRFKNFTSAKRVLLQQKQQICIRQTGPNKSANEEKHCCDYGSAFSKIKEKVPPESKLKGVEK